ncbi:MAG: hypothetical protein ACO1OO_01680 [Flavisolibacter sp.]
MDLLAIGYLLDTNEISLAGGVLISVLFYLQYRKYQHEQEKEEMIDNFLRN